MQEKKEMGELSTQKMPDGTGAGDAALIADLQLGQVEEVYTLNRSLRVFMLCLVGVALVLFPLGIWLYTRQMGFPLSLVPSLGTSLVPLLLCFPVSLRYGNMRVFICTDGLVSLQHKKRESLRWDEVNQVRRQFTGGRNGRTSIRLSAQDGRQLSFAPPDREAHLLTTLQAKGAQYGFEVTRK